MSEESIELAKAVYAALNRRDLEAALALMHPEIEFRSLVASDGRTYRGHDAVREWWNSVSQSLGGLRYEAQEIEAFRDRGITRLRIVGTVEGVEIPQMFWQAWRIRDGLVSWWEGFRTEAEALAAVGLRE